MKLNAKQAAQKLGVSKSVIARLIRDKRLTDYGVTKDGGTRHQFILDSVEVNALKKSDDAPRGRPHFARVNGSAGTPVPAPAPVLEQPKLPGVLERIEAKLDQLIRMWS